MAPREVHSHLRLQVKPKIRPGLTRCYFIWKFTYSCVAFYRYLAWKFKTFMWHNCYNIWNFYGL